MKCRHFWMALATAALLLLSSTPALANDYGCTPGYWKQDQHFDSWVTYSPTDTVLSVFPGIIDLNFADGSSLPAGMTLLEALQGGGGTTLAGAARIYLRAAVAKLLNITAAVYIGTPTEVELKGYVASAINSDDRTFLITDAAIWDADNNGILGCPLN